MSKNESRTNPIWYLVGIIIVGLVAWWVIKFLIAIFFYVLLGAVIVGAFMLYTRSKRALRRGDRREIDS